MTPKDIRTAISNQCGFKAEHRCPNCNVLISSGKNLCHACDLELAIWQQKTLRNPDPLPNKAKTQPQRLLESIIPNKARDPRDLERPLTDEAFNLGNKTIQVCNAGDWPTVEDQQRYWQERDEHLDRTESNAQWIDSKAKNERHPFA